MGGVGQNLFGRTPRRRAGGMTCSRQKRICPGVIHCRVADGWERHFATVGPAKKESGETKFPTRPLIVARTNLRSFQKTFGAYCIQPGSCPPRKRQDGLRGHINQTLLFPTTDERNPTLCAKSLFEKYTSSPVHRTMGRIFDRMAHSTPIWGRKRPGGFARLCGRKRGDGVPDLGGTTLDGRTIGQTLFDGRGHDP